jgi:hypothetical protein
MSQIIFPFARVARAKAFVRSASSKLQHDILPLLGERPALNRQEIADLLRKGIQSVCRPVQELLLSKQIIETGEFRKARCGFASLVALARKQQKRKRGSK